MRKYKPETKKELKELVFTDGIKLCYIDTSLITDMSKLFYESKRKDFEGIEDWETSNVTNMDMMFAYMGYKMLVRYSKIDFNPDLSNWNVSKVKSMNNMFAYCSNFNQPLNNWNISKVEDLSNMFSYCHIFNQPLNDWDVSNVKNMESLFDSCESFNQPLDKWDTSNVENMFRMFDDCKKFNQPLNSWNVSNVTNIACMFMLAESFNQPLDKWNTKKVISIAFLFKYADKFDNYESLEHWNLDKLKDITLVCDDENKLHTRLKVYMQVFYPKEDHITITKDNVKEIYDLISKDKNRRIAKLRKKLENDFSSVIKNSDKKTIKK